MRVLAVAWCGLAAIAVGGNGSARAEEPVMPFPSVPVQTIPLTAVEDIAFDATRGVLWASVATQVQTATGPVAAQYPNSIVAVDPVSGQVGPAIPVGADPKDIAVADDGSYLYVAVADGTTIQRVDLAARAVDFEFGLGTVPPPSPAFPMRAGQLEVLPGNAHAVLVQRGAGGVGAAIAIYDDGVQRPQTAIGPAFLFPPGDGSRMFTFGGSDRLIRSYTIAASGATLAASTTDTLDGSTGGLSYSAGRLFDGENQLDAATLQVIGRIEGASGPNTVRADSVPYADPSGGKLYRLSPCGLMYSFAGDTLREVGRFDIRCGATGRNDHTPMITVGSRFAFIAQLAIHLVDVGAISSAAGEYTALTPERILDTRVGVGAPIGQVGPGGTLDVQITGRGGVPTSGVAAVVLNATAANSTSASYLTVWPTGRDRPDISNLNYTAGATRANLVTVAVGAGGAVSLFNEQGSTDVLFDVVGYYSTATGVAGARFRPLPPVRAFDTRSGIGGVPAAPVGPGQTMPFNVTGTGGVPSGGVTAVVLNVTVVGPTADTYLTVWPDDAAQPNASNLNARAGSTVPNLVTVRVPASGVVDFYNFAGATHLLADVVGYYTADRTGEAGRFLAFAPYRLLDTRTRYYPGGSIGRLDAGERLEVRDDAARLDAYVLNVTATGTQGAGYLSVYPIAPAPPTASNLNYADGDTVPNSVVVRSEFGFSLLSGDGSTEVIVDVFGAFTGG
jgi:hypothetical protein